MQTDESIRLEPRKGYQRYGSSAGVYDTDPESNWHTVSHQYYSPEPRLDEYRDRSQFAFIAANYWYIFKSFFWCLFRFRTVFITGLSVGFTILCYNYKLYTDIPVALVASSLFFPLSFGISYALSRRERVLMDVTSMKSHILSLYMIAVHWPIKKDEVALETADRLKNALQSLLDEMMAYLNHQDIDGRCLYRIYERFDDIFRMIEDIRLNDQWVGNAIQMAYNYHKSIMIDFERIRSACDYRLPSTFRGYSSVWLALFSIVFGPYFAKIAHNEMAIWAGIYNAIFVSLVLVTLSEVNDDLEDPFDGQGEDDLNMEMLSEPKIMFMHWDRTKKHRFAKRDN